MWYGVACPMCCGGGQLVTMDAYLADQARDGDDQLCGTSRGGTLHQVTEGAAEVGQAGCPGSALAWLDCATWRRVCKG